MDNPIINRVANSTLQTIDLEELYPEGKRYELDIAPVLYQGMLLREKDFRAWVKEHSWEQYADGFVAIFCSEDAIIPVWAYMLIASKLAGLAKEVHLGTLPELEDILFTRLIEEKDWKEYSGAKLVIKGCSKRPVPQSAYTKLSFKLASIASSIMYGEPCSTVPVFKSARK
jgi:hypothetical protein